MRIAVIQATSQISKNGLIVDAVKKYASSSEIFNFGCTKDDEISYSYIEIAVFVGLLLAGKSVDFVVTGCSSGQGMMLACKSMPGVLCGYAPTPQDAYLFAQINNGNAVSLPLGEGYTWSGQENLEQTIARLFSEPFGQGYPKDERERKIGDANLLKRIRGQSQVGFVDLLHTLDNDLIQKIMTKKDVVDFVFAEGADSELRQWFDEQKKKCSKNFLLRFFLGGNGCREIYCKTRISRLG